MVAEEDDQLELARQIMKKRYLAHRRAAEETTSSNSSGRDASPADKSRKKRTRSGLDEVLAAAKAETLLQTASSDSSGLISVPPPSKHLRVCERQPRIVMRDPRVSQLLRIAGSDPEEAKGLARGPPAEKPAEGEAARAVGECEEPDLFIPEDEQSRGVRILTWNIDGLSDAGRRTRTLAVVQTIRNLALDAAYLQEVVPDTAAIIQKTLGDEYSIFRSSSAFQPYFCLLLVNSKTWRVSRSKCHDFANTQMCRHLLLTEATHIKTKRKVLHMTAHLESCRESASERVAQLSEVMEKFFVPATKSDEYSLVVFGGDLNLRDSEAKEVPTVREVAVDCWEASGASPDTKYTWDLKVNGNLGPLKPRCRYRFDRMYAFAKSSTLDSKTVAFNLIGKWTLQDRGLFPSDHFGILCRFKLMLE